MLLARKEPSTPHPSIHNHTRQFLAASTVLSYPSLSTSSSSPPPSVISFPPSSRIPFFTAVSARPPPLRPTCCPVRLRLWPCRLLGHSRVTEAECFCCAVDEHVVFSPPPRFAPEPSTHTHSNRQARVVPSIELIFCYSRLLSTPPPPSRLARLREAPILSLNNRRNPPRSRRVATKASSATPKPVPNTSAPPPHTEPTFAPPNVSRPRSSSYNFTTSIRTTTYAGRKDVWLVWVKAATVFLAKLGFTLCSHGW